jgi:hypothetical protein
MVSNLLKKKRWQYDFATVKRQRDGFRACQKETGCHPASSRPTSSTGYNGKYIQESVNTIFLGLQIDNHLNWTNHIEKTDT